ncbi:hypothetical protein P9E76_18655 [Schinkia azotoformans]|uniref:Uncharacterized protein n=1 Tax=Schinkia azotoformans LMG 9581 TaxID=1131731 RepID=K6E433_SCHAZ|nr:hypothetical protein [Schinkia azotoformans]EKN67976.1 hypothetical protein BAZO_07174 [Schinkia azotoformans LMG 9581]MEC1637004.1 hypothetical protein [Schinkia azotoformans]MEC1722176.1 hypothetical protein [Schinkia azotoformans]MEC1947030.1 hypothetical protein [Schinkia azotoformans]MED4412462.1 hypothetical protein [Schinkia azotoformans]
MGGMTFYIQKKFGSYGDALAAVGLARLLSILFHRHDIQIEEQPGYFRCLLPEEIDYEQMDIEELKRNPVFRYVQFTENEEGAPVQAFKYYRDQELYKAERGRKKSNVNLSDNAEEAPLPPDPIYLLMQSLRVLQALGTSNKLYKDIQAAPIKDLKQTIIGRLNIYSSLEQEAIDKEAFKPSVSAVQAYNPIIGKGVNKAKAQSISVGSIPAKFVDWFEEWLRFIGSNLVLNAYPIWDDLKFLTLVPNNVTVAGLLILHDSFLKQRDYTSCKNDIFVIFNTVKFLVENSERFINATTEDDFLLSIMDITPKTIISGLSGAYFKSLGSGRVLINNSFISFPDWFPINNEKDADLWINVIQDHKNVLGKLDETKSEEMQLLNTYRDFLSTSDWKKYFEYTSSYAGLYLNQKERKKYFAQHNFEIFKGVCQRVGQIYKEIISNKGFQEIAKAMREATVNEQYRKTQGKQQFEIQYGLFQEIKRKAKFEDQVISVINDFISEYNRETARKMEQKGENYKGRLLVSLDAFNDFISLFDQFPKKHETIALMLVAAASCYDGKPKKVEGGTGE